MNTAETPIGRYDRTTVLLHWTTAVLVVGLWILAQVIDDFANPARIMVRSLHITLGLVLMVVLLWRLTWRLRGGVRLPDEHPLWMHRIAQTTHIGLYALLAATVVMGVTNELVRGDNIFTLFKLPSIAPGNRALRGTVGDLHGLLANALLILAGFHATAALFRHYVLRDGLLRRMGFGAP